MSYLPPVNANAVLDFDRDNMTSCVLSERASGKESYRVETTNKLKTTSIYRAGEDTPLAVVQRHNLLPDKITFAGEETLKVGKWLRTQVFSS